MTPLPDEGAGRSTRMPKGTGHAALTSALTGKTPIALLLFSEAWLLLASWSMWWWTVEDSYIGFRYVRNFARGFGLVLNRGERVEGYTNFLWLVLLAAFSKLAPDLMTLSKVLGTLFNALALVACFDLCRIVSTRKARVKGIALVLTGASAIFVATSVEGLETPLFTMLLCWEAVTYLRGLRAADGRQAEWLVGSSILSALLIMTRPDGALTYGLLWVHAAWRFRAKPKMLAVFTLPAVLLYAPYFVCRWRYYGFLFPNTLYAKGGGTPALFSLGAAHISQFLSLQTGGLALAGMVALFVMLVPSTETTVLGLAVLSRLIFEFWSGGVTAGNSRFLVPALPLIWILTERLFVAWLQTARLGWRGPCILAGVSALLLASETVQFASFRRSRQREQAGLKQAHISLGNWLRENSLPDAKVAVGDIGAIGYWSGLRILDLDGLADVHIAHQRGRFGDKGDAPYVLAQHPDWVILRARRCEPQQGQLPMGTDGKIYADEEFQNHFERLSCWDFSPNYHLLLFCRRNP